MNKVDIRSLLRAELKLHLLKSIENFKSKEISGKYKLTKDDIIYCLSSIINRNVE